MPDANLSDRRWTAERQLAFLDMLVKSRSVSKAARAAGMSRESAYRLRRRPAGALLGAAWDRIMLGHRFERPLPRAAEGKGRLGNGASLSNLSMS